MDKESENLNPNKRNIAAKLSAVSKFLKKNKIKLIFAAFVLAGIGSFLVIIVGVSIFAALLGIKVLNDRNKEKKFPFSNKKVTTKINEKEIIETFINEISVKIPTQKTHADPEEQENSLTTEKKTFKVFGEMPLIVKTKPPSANNSGRLKNPVRL
jgi:hypothetical protein